jgi:hypothetical protein
MLRFNDSNPQHHTTGEYIMNTTTKSDTSVKVINAAREEELLGMLRTLHGKVLTCLTEVGQKPTFPEDFSKCVNEDYKNIHQASRTLISAARKARWEQEVAGIREGINVVVSAAMSKKGAQYAQFLTLDADLRASIKFDHNVVIPFSAIASAFAQGTTPEQMVNRCKELSYTVVKLETGYAIKCAFTPKSDKVVEEAPKSETKAA